MDDEVKPNGDVTFGVEWPRERDSATGLLSGFLCSL